MCNSKFDRPLPSSKDPFFQNEAKRTTFLVKMSLTCMRKKGNFHVKGWALNRVLIQRPGEVWNGLFSRFSYVWEQLFFTSAWRPFMNGDFKKKNLNLKISGRNRTNPDGVKRTKISLWLSLYEIYLQILQCLSLNLSTSDCRLLVGVFPSSLKNS